MSLIFEFKSANIYIEAHFAEYVIALINIICEAMEYHICMCIGYSYSQKSTQTIEHQCFVFGFVMREHCKNIYVYVLRLVSWINNFKYLYHEICMCVSIFPFERVYRICRCEWYQSILKWWGRIYSCTVQIQVFLPNVKGHLSWSFYFLCVLGIGNSHIINYIFLHTACCFGYHHGISLVY